MEKAENLIQHNIGAGMMEELLKAGNELVYKNELDGSVNMYGATNASLRIKLEEQGKEIENLKEIVKDLRDMIRGQRKQIENLEDVIWETDENVLGTVELTRKLNMRWINRSVI